MFRQLNTEIAYGRVERARGYRFPCRLGLGEPPPKITGDPDPVLAGAAQVNDSCESAQY